MLDEEETKEVVTKVAWKPKIVTP